MIKKEYPLFLANHAQKTNAWLPVTDKFSGEVISQVALANAGLVQQAIEKAEQVKKEMAALPAYERQRILAHCVRRFEERREELAHVLCVEVGKPLRDARAEVDRLILTFETARDESVRMYGEYMPLDFSERSRGDYGIWKRVPVGVCSFISPFNFPLNLTAHKIAPAIAAGCPFILKPASRTPISALLIGEVLSETALPKGAFSILPIQREGADLFVTDERLKLLSFTGSPKVGWDLKARAGKKKVVLELGGNAACVVDETADIEKTVDRLLVGAFSQSGQSCISVQRIFIHESIYKKVAHRLSTLTTKLHTGNPALMETVVGPLISEEEAKRVEEWVNTALANGATLLCGGKRKGAVYSPTLLENVPATEKVCAEEVFGPLAVLESYQDFDAVLEKVNASHFGLQAGIFTRDLYRAQKAWERLEVGGVIIGDIPSWRVDPMPYGGVKDSGLGREGVRWAMEDMTELRLMVVRSEK